MDVELVTFFTDFADQGVMLPVVVAVALTLLLLGRIRIAVVWMIAIGSVLATMLLLKLALWACVDLAPALPFARLGLVSPSGHVASAAAAYGGLAALLGREAGSSTAVRRTWMVALGVAALVGITRVLSGDHTIAEVVTGGVVGVLAASALARLAPGRMRGKPGAALAGVTLAVMLAFHGVHFSLEQEIQAASAHAVREWRSIDLVR